MEWAIDMRKKYTGIAAFIALTGVLIFHLVFLLNLKFTAWPEMLTWPYLIVSGWLPYKDIAIAHTPLMLADLFIFFKVFGVGIMQLKIFTWILILGLDVLVFWIARKFWGVRVAFLSLFTYVLLQVVYEGNGLWFDLYMTLLALLSFYFLQSKKYLLAGIFWALAFLSKQTAFWFLIPIGATILIDNNVQRSLKATPLKVGRFALGALGPALSFIGILYFFGILPDFYKWAIEFGIGVLPRAIGQIQLPTARQLLVYLSPFLLLLPLLFKIDKKNIPLILFAVFGMMGVLPRWELFHFQPGLPFLAIAGGIGSGTFLKNKLRKFVFFIPLIFVMILFAKTLVNDWGKETRFYENGVKRVSEYVRANTQIGDRILVLNWWDSIYVFSNTISSTRPWVPQLEWYMEQEGVQDVVLKSLRLNPPELVVLNPYSDSGLAAYKPQKVLEWVIRNYKISENVSGLEVWLPK